MNTTTWSLDNGWLFAGAGPGMRTHVATVCSHYGTSTFWMYVKGHVTQGVDLHTQDYTEARQIAETILRLEGVI